MKTIRRILPVLLIFVAVAYCDAQSVRVIFNYDECGNRTQRSIEFKKNKDKSLAKGTHNDDDWLAEVNDTIAGVSLSLFPNPTNDGFTLVILNEPEAVSLHAILCTAEGSIIEERDITQTTEAFDLGGKANGIYLLRLWTGNEIQTWKIIKK